MKINFYLLIDLQIKLEKNLDYINQKKKIFFKHNNIQIFTPNKSFSNNFLIYGKNNNSDIIQKMVLILLKIIMIII